MSPTNPLPAVSTRWRSKEIDSPISSPNPSWRSRICLASALTLGLPLHGSQIGSSSFSSAATVVDFSDLTGGDCNLCGPTVSNQYATLGVVFSNPSFPGDDTVDTNLAAFLPDFPFPNTLFVYQGGLISDAPAVPFQISFSVPVTMVGFDYGSSLDAYLEVDVYGANNQWIDTLIFVGNRAPIGLDGFAGIQESTPIAQLDVSYHPYSDPSRTLNFAVDDLRFEASSTPEPSSIAFLATGLFVLALYRRRRWGSRQ